MKSDEMRWICDECGEPIGDDEGYIEAYNRKPNHGGPVGGYPINPSPTMPLTLKPGQLLTVTPQMRQGDCTSDEQRAGSP